jgi:hypothetical protein
MGRKGERERGREVEKERGERCDFLVPLHDKSVTGQVVALAHLDVSGEGLLIRYGPSLKGAEAAIFNTGVKDRRQNKK